VLVLTIGVHVLVHYNVCLNSSRVLQMCISNLCSSCSSDNRQYCTVVVPHFIISSVHYSVFINIFTFSAMNCFGSLPRQNILVSFLPMCCALCR